MTKRFVLGVLGGPFGLKGHLKFRPWSGENAHILRLKTVTLSPPNRGKAPRTGGRAGVRAGDGDIPDGDAGGSYTVEEAAVSGTGVLLKFKGIDSPEKAKTLAGYELVVDRADAAGLGPGEYYVEDLRGLAVAALRDGGPAAPDDPALEVLGRVTDIIEGGGGLLLEMRPGQGALLPAEGGDAAARPAVPPQRRAAEKTAPPGRRQGGGAGPAGRSPAETDGGKDSPSRQAARLIPFRHEFFGEISLEHGVIVLLSRWIVE